MTHEDYVSFEQAQKLKELGFDWECETFWDDEGSPHEHEWVIKQLHNYPYVRNDEDCTIFRPTLAQAAKWLREVKKICVEIRIYPIYMSWFGKIFDLKDYPNIKFVLGIGLWETYEKALSASIDKALELLK